MRPDGRADEDARQGALRQAHAESVRPGVAFRGADRRRRIVSQRPSGEAGSNQQAPEQCPGGRIRLVDKNSQDDAADAELDRSIGDWLTEQVFSVQLESVVIDDRFERQPSEPRAFGDLRPPNHGYPPWMVSISPEVHDGHLDESGLEVIGERPDATALRVSGLDQAGFERLAARYGAQFLAIEVEHCPLIADLSPLEDLPGLRLVTVFRNQRATRLWNLSRTPCLTGLQFTGFSRLHDLRDLQAGASLLELRFGDVTWPSAVFESLDPLAALTGLRSLKFDAKRIDDGRIEPLGKLTGLQALTFPANMFTTRQVAWLRARLPASVESEMLAPVIRYEPSPDDHGDTRDALLVGKRKPFLNSVTHAGRIKKHAGEFWQMVSDFQRDPALSPD